MLENGGPEKEHCSTWNCPCVFSAVFALLAVFVSSMAEKRWEHWRGWEWTTPGCRRWESRLQTLISRDLRLFVATTSIVRREIASQPLLHHRPDLYRHLFRQHRRHHHLLFHHHYFYRTLVRSLAMLVTHWLTNSLLFSKLDWCDSGVWRCQLKTCWGC